MKNQQQSRFVWMLVMLLTAAWFVYTSVQFVCGSIPMIVGIGRSVVALLGVSVSAHLLAACSGNRKHDGFSPAIAALAIGASILVVAALSLHKMFHQL